MLPEVKIMQCFLAVAALDMDNIYQCQTCHLTVEKTFNCSLAILEVTMVNRW